MFIPLDNKKFSKNLVIFPGLYYDDKNVINEQFKLETLTQLDNDTISEKLFIKLYQNINADHEINYTKKTQKPKSKKQTKQIKQTKQTKKILKK